MEVSGIETECNKICQYENNSSNCFSIQVGFLPVWAKYLLKTSSKVISGSKIYNIILKEKLMITKQLLRLPSVKENPEKSTEALLPSGLFMILIAVGVSVVSKKTDKCQ